MSIQLPRLISDGMIIQRGKRIHIWGFSEKNEQLTVCFNSDNISTVADSNGRFDVYFDAMQAGGPYSLRVSDSNSEVTVENIYTGDVFIMSGQSNMEFPMSRVRDTFPEEWNGREYKELKVFKIIENGAFNGPLEELESGEWKSISPDMLDTCPALGYFLCKSLYEKTGVRVGVINASLGGSPIEAWMSSDMLKDYPEKLKVSEKYKDRAYIEKVIENNNRISSQWIEKLDSIDEGVINNWQCLSDTSKMEKLNIPVFFDETELNGHIGSVWLYKTFNVSEEFASKSNMLWLGTLTDSDITYVNGIEVGRTEYRYPPRRYKVEKGILKPGENTICIRLIIENGTGRVTPKKKLAIFNGSVKREMIDGSEEIIGADEIIALDGEWGYKIGAKMDRIAPTDFINWKPTALYNGMLHPCTNYPVAAFIWYQGESNTDITLKQYADMTKSQISALRSLWQDESLPYIYTKLPNFTLNGYEKDVINYNETAWNDLKRVQDRLEKEIPYSYMAVTDGMGEDNDVHPQNKKAVAEEYVKIIINNKIVE